MRRNRYFDWEQAFHFIWENADRDGIWHGDAVSLAKEFDASEDDAGSVLDELRDRLLIEMPTKDFAEPAWRDCGAVHVVGSIAEAYELADQYAYEHVQILTAHPREALEMMNNYGALFLGEGTCVSYGDKVIGTNHVLPTRGAARYTGGLWVGNYLKDRHLSGDHEPGIQCVLR